MEGDTQILRRFTDYIQCQGYHLKHVAFLSEDETAFGSQPSTSQDQRDLPCSEKPRKLDPDDHPIYLYYPRDIATLRSAYEKQSILTPSKPAAETTPSTSLRGDLSEPATSQHDTVRTYGGQLEPLAQESLLLNIVNILSEHHTQFVIIRSTNSLDQIFLTQFIRRVFPEARVVIDGSDLLFRRGAEGTSLRGVMTLSPYPLLIWQQDWSPSALLKGNGSYRVFGEDVSQGIYVAARYLLETGATPPIVPISGYASPSWASQGEDTRKDHPATWISVIGHHQFWPVAVLRKGSGILQTLPTLSDGDTAPLHIGSELKVLLLLGAVWSILHLLWCLRGSVVPTTAAFRLACFAPLPRKQHPFLIAMGSLLPAFAAIVTAASTGLLSWNWNTGRGLALASWVLGMVVSSVWACGGNYRLPVARGTSTNRLQKDWRPLAGISAVVVLALFCLFYLYLVHKLTPENKIPLYWRSAHLLSGVSPLLPQWLLLVGMYMWFWFSLRGLALFGDDRPRLPKKADLPVSDDVLRRAMTPMFSREGAEKPLERIAIPWGKRHLRVLLVLVPAAILIFGLALEDAAVRTLGERAFGIEIFLWISFCIALILADTAQVWMIWKKLHSLLNYLDRLPVRRTLAALRGLSWASVWRMSGNTMEERYRVISRQFESLRHLANSMDQWTPTNTSPKELAEEEYRKEQLVGRIKQCQKSGADFATWYVTLRKQSRCDIIPLRSFQEELAATAGSVLKNLLLPAWRNETDSLIFDRKTDHAEKEEGTRVAFNTEKVPAHVLAGEEFFVLPYLAFIQNVLGRIRTIVLGSLCLFVATTFAVSSYPFDPLSTLGALFLGVFAVTGGTVILVFAQMNRDATLSYITNTNPGELGGHFWVQLVTFGVGPLLGLLTTLFPSLTDFVTSWLQPGVEALK